jgi:L-serine kinase (ATP) / ParB family transcriptional regulator, heme-responsive regulator
MSTDDAPQLRLPDLRFVPVETLVPHEQHDPHRSGPLAQRFRDQGVLRNPPVVTPLPPDEERYMVLDGANRATAAQEAGFPHVVVQVVRYEDPGVRLMTWHHALSGLPIPDLERALAAVPGLTTSEGDLRHARAVLARREAIAFVALPAGRAIMLGGGGELNQRNAVLNAMVDAYRTRIPFFRVASESLGDAQAEHPEVTALVVFPHFEPAELLELSGSGARLPAGITRHVIPKRALRLDVPLARLADRDQTLADKNRWLADWLRDKMQRRQVRFYQESTVLFDE